MPHRFTETDAQHFHAEIRGCARALFRFAVTKPRDVACLQRGKVAFAFGFAEKTGEAFNDALVTRVRGWLGLDFFHLQPRLAPRLDGSTRQRFDICRRENIAHTACDHFTRSVHAQLAVAREQRGFLPCAADFQRLLLVAGFRGAKYAPARVGFRIENRECAKPKRSARLLMNAHGA